MTNRSPDAAGPLPAAVSPGRLADAERDALLELRLIASLAMVGRDGMPHVVGMWFRREGDALLFPTSQHTLKVRLLRTNPRAAAMVDISRAGLDLRGVVVRGNVDLIEGDEARRLNRSIHARYVTEAGLADPAVAAYLTAGDDVTIRLPFDRVATWNLADQPAGRRLRETRDVHALDG
jgi:nitroimidazol reductase NimA-like FMN-containing flavoprotein (pyridoxamine 5'-phosphate oxidase superfamily)